MCNKGAQAGCTSCRDGWTAQPQLPRCAAAARQPGSVLVQGWDTSHTASGSSAVRHVPAPGPQDRPCRHQRALARHLAAARILGAISAVHPAAGAHSAAHLGVACERGRMREGRSGAKWRGREGRGQRRRDGDAAGHRAALFHTNNGRKLCCTSHPHTRHQFHNYFRKQSVPWPRRHWRPGWTCQSAWQSSQTLHSSRTGSRAWGAVRMLLEGS